MLSADRNTELRDELRDEIRDKLSDEIRDKLRDELRDELIDELLHPVARNRAGKAWRITKVPLFMFVGSFWWVI